MSLIGQIIDDRYEVIDFLGNGAMAFVFEADDLKENNRKVALKIMQSPLDRQPPLRKRFRGEFEACQRLNHDNIVKVYSMGELPSGSPYYAMEYLPYPALDDILLREGDLSAERTISYLRQMASAFDHFHPTGVVHRDLKPANIIIAENERLVLVDFGLARDINRTTLTKTGAMIGTPLYLSPDILMGLKVDGRSDIFSLGVIGYEMLTGEKPFMANTLEEVVSRIMVGRPEPVTKLVPGISPAWNSFFRKCFRRDPDDRFQNGQEVIKALETIKSGGRLGTKKSKVLSSSTPSTDSSAAVAARQVMERLQPNKSNQQRALMAGLLFSFLLLIGGLYWIGSKAGWFKEANYTITSLKAESDVGEIVVTWQSETPYPSRVMVNELERVFHGVGGETTDHSVLLEGLKEGKSYSFKVLLPNGKSSMLKRATTRRFEFKIGEAQIRENELQVDLAASRAISVVFHTDKGSVIRAKRREGDNFRVSLPESVTRKARKVTIDVQVNESRKETFVLNDLLQQAVNKTVKELKTLVPKNYVDGLEGNSSASVTLIVNKMNVDDKKRFVLSDEEQKAENARKRANMSTSKNKLEKKLEERRVVDRFRRALALSPLILGTKLCKVSTRYAFYENIWKLASFSLFVIYKEGPRLKLPWPELGEFACSATPLVGEVEEQLIYARVAEGAILVEEFTKGAEVARVGSRTPFATDHVPSVWRTSFTVDSLQEFDLAEFKTRLSTGEAGALAIMLNGYGPIYHYSSPIVAKKHGQGPYYQRFPIEYLKEGQNEISFTFDAMYGQLSRRTIHINKLVLRLVKKR